MTDRFIQFGYDLYRGDPRWIPPLRDRLAAQLSPGFFFYEQPGTAHQHFLVTDGSRVLARASAFVNPALADSDGIPVGSIGFFECVNDYGSARTLLDSATRWLFDQGITRIWAPLNFDIWHGYRFMTRGFETAPFFPEPYNKPYYPDFLVRYGFTKRQTWNSFTLSQPSAIHELVQRSAPRYEQLTAKGYRFEPFDLDDFNGSLQTLHPLLLRSFSGFLGYTPIPLNEFTDLFGPFQLALHPKLGLFVYDPEHQLVGFALSFVDLAEAVRSMNGKSSLTTRLRFLRKARMSRRTMFYLAGATPEESVKRSGIGRATMHRILASTLNEGFTEVIFALIADGNIARGSFGGNAIAPDREYALFELRPRGQP